MVKLFQYVFPPLVIVLLALWLGGLVTLVVFVSSLFAHDRTLATDAAPWLFYVFERYQIGVGVAAVLAAASWCIFEPCRLRAMGLGMTLIGMLLAILEISYVTPHVNGARGIDPATFQYFHHLATVNYVAMSVAVLLAVVAMLLSIMSLRAAGAYSGSNSL